MGGDSVQLILVNILTAASDSAWLRDAACAGDDADDYFVEAGRTMPQEKLNLCRACPVRKDCLKHAYQRDIGPGFFGGLSPAQRRKMDLESALEFCEIDLVRDLGKKGSKKKTKK